jgi:3-phenylpropionate/trans-cinnamate dioxygenase ferredoxin reductase component
MADRHSDYLIVGAGLAGTSAIEGIRELDQNRSITMIGSENHLPYDRPPLSKKLWFGQKKVEDIFLHDRTFYDNNGVMLLLGRRVVELDAKSKTVRDSNGEIHQFGKLLLATGGVPQTLRVPGGDIDGVCYYRYLDDYLRTRELTAAGKSAVVVGGGFIGSELAAALCINKVNVTLINHSVYLCKRVFPESLGLAMERLFQSRSIRMLKGQGPASFERKGSRLVVRIADGEQIEVDMVIAGVGIRPADDLAKHAGLNVDNGVIVNEYLQTSNPDIYAAGDIARFPYRALGPTTRLEHWDNALNQGKHAARNMAGAHDPFTYMPYFFSDLFEFGYEAVGEVDSRLETFADWQKENEKGVIYYMKEGKVRGAMMCNVWDKVRAARELIERGETMPTGKLRGVIA